MESVGGARGPKAAAAAAGGGEENSDTLHTAREANFPIVTEATKPSNSKPGTKSSHPPFLSPRTLEMAAINSKVKWAGLRAVIDSLEVRFSIFNELISGPSSSLRWSEVSGLGSFCSMGEIVGPRLYCCYKCRNHVSLHDDIISKAFQGRHGRAFLFSHAMNIVVGAKEDRHLYWVSTQLLISLVQIAMRYWGGSTNVLMRHHRNTKRVNSYLRSRKLLRRTGRVLCDSGSVSISYICKFIEQVGSLLTKCLLLFLVIDILQSYTLCITEYESTVEELVSINTENSLECGCSTLARMDGIQSEPS
ncbi:protein yippee-like [Sesamum angolense]|uniref:Protein yippee-like n=1 Tax=Sesamum angolense TaxID=2727404 RepID=A0AAE1W1C8_9LAMI|nr:protein yippee-like [Sesamum angolense]